MGCFWRSSQTTKETSATAAVTEKPVIIDDANQLSSWPLSSTTSSVPSPSASRPKPTKSIGAAGLPFTCWRCGGSVTTREVSKSETTPTGTLMRKTQRHE